MNESKIMFQVELKSPGRRRLVSVIHSPTKGRADEDQFSATPALRRMPDIALNWGEFRLLTLDAHTYLYNLVTEKFTELIYEDAESLLEEMKRDTATSEYPTQAGKRLIKLLEGYRAEQKELA